MIFIILNSLFLSTNPPPSNLGYLAKSSFINHVSHGGPYLKCRGMHS
jgi:hypothetical protein